MFQGDRRAKSYPFPTLTKYTAFMNPSVGVQNVMWTKCLILQSGDQRVCICTVDAIGADGGLFRAAYQTAVDQGFTIPFDNVILSASHSHSAPGAVSTELLWEVAPATDIYRKEVRQMWANMIAAAMIEADRNIRPVRFGIGISDLYDMTHNRRAHYSPYVNGSSIDPQLSIFRIDDDTTGEPLVTLWNFAIHGTCYDADQMKQCSDIMGLANELIEKQVGGISMFVNSDAGDIAPSHCDNKPDIAGSHMIADAVAAARNQISTVASSAGMDLQVASATIEFGKTHLNLTLERILNCTTGICLLCETKFLHCHADVQLDHNWVENTPKFTGIRIKLNGVTYGIVTAPGEPIQELGRQIKGDGKSLGFDQVMLFGYSNNHMGYFCTPREYLVGGYESTLNFWGINTGNYIRGNCTLALGKVAPK